MINYIKKIFKKEPLRFFELLFLSLMLLSLPSFEAPKNIFQALFIITFIARQYLYKSDKKWGGWDWIFLSYIISAFLSAVFAGFAPGWEWKGFRGMLFWTTFGWTLSRTNYSEKEITWIFWVAILSAIPPLAWGLIQNTITHSKNLLELNSVGHANHSAIFLAIIFGAVISSFLSTKKLSIIKSVLIGVFFIAIIIGQSRAALGISVVYTILILFTLSEGKKNKIISFTIILFLLLFNIFNNAEVFKKERNNENNNNILSDRDRVWRTSLEAARFYPLLGIGNSNWKLISYEKIKESLELRGENFDQKKYYPEAHHAHNLYLNALTERGIVGILCLMALIFYWLKTLIRSYRYIQYSELLSMLWGASMSAWLVTSGVGMVNSTFHHETAIIALFFLGLHLAYLKKIQLKFRD